MTTTTISKVWHHRPEHKVGQPVLDLHGLEGFGGWMPFLHARSIMRMDNAGAWQLQPTRIKSSIEEIKAYIETAGYLMLPIEAPLLDPKNVPLFKTGLVFVHETLEEAGLVDTLANYYRIPDHVGPNIENRMAFVSVLDLTCAIFIAVKGYGPGWTQYLSDVRVAAIRHTPICYMDAYDRNTYRPFTQDRILNTVRFAHGGLINPQIVFRQSGPAVAQAILWTLEWLGKSPAEEQTP